MRQINVSGFLTTIIIIYDQNKQDDLQALEDARRELMAEIIREKARRKE